MLEKTNMIDHVEDDRQLLVCLLQMVHKSLPWPHLNYLLLFLIFLVPVFLFLYFLELLAEVDSTQQCERFFLLT